MAIYKYQQLARDIERLIKAQEYEVFTAHTVKDFINTRKGFYKYSNSTLYRALNLLIEQGVILSFQHNRHVPTIYAHLDNMRNYLRNEVAHDSAPF